jgi:hypothetical protein
MVQGADTRAASSPAISGQCRTRMPARADPALKTIDHAAGLSALQPSVMHPPWPEDRAATVGHSRSRRYPPSRHGGPPEESPCLDAFMWRPENR